MPWQARDCGGRVPHQEKIVFEDEDELMLLLELILEEAEEK